MYLTSGVVFYDGLMSPCGCQDAYKRRKPCNNYKWSMPRGTLNVLIFSSDLHTPMEKLHVMKKNPIYHTTTCTFVIYKTAKAVDNVELQKYPQTTFIIQGYHRLHPILNTK